MLLLELVPGCFETSQRSMTYLTLVSLSPMAVPAFLDRDSGTLKDLLGLPMSTIDTTGVASLCHNA